MMIAHRLSRVLAPVLVVLFAAAPIGCDGEASECPEGSETCPCTAEYKCLEGLMCLSDRCVDVFWTPPSNSPGDEGGEGGGGGDGGTANNVDACEAWTRTLSGPGCESSELVQLANCSAFASLPCDLNANGYFDCLSDNTVCMLGGPDVSGWAQCASLAVCE